MIREKFFVGGRGGSIRASAFRPGRRLLLTTVIVAVTGAVAWSTAHAGPLEDAALQTAIDGLASSADDKITESVTKLGALDDPRAIPALDALGDERLRLGADGHAYVWDSKTRDAAKCRHRSGRHAGAAAA